MQLYPLLSAARHRWTVQLIRAGHDALARLPYRQIICLDTEFRSAGDPHRGWCLCGINLRDGEEYRLWLDGYDGPPPFPLDESTLFVAFVAGAEIATLRARGWPMPARIFDLYQEMRVVTNTGQRSDPRSLEAVCAHYGISMVEHDTKKAMQDEAQTRTVWPEERQRELIEYCMQDAWATARLFLCVLAEWLDLQVGREEWALHHALRRGLFAGTLAEAELRGIPFNMNDWRDLNGARDTIYSAMVDELPPDLRTIYRDTRDGPVFTQAQFERVMVVTRSG